MTTSVDLIPMTAAEYAAWMPAQISSYAANKVRAGVWAQSDALELSRSEIVKLLPSGLRTPTHRFFNVVCGMGRETVGSLWLKVPTPIAGGIGFIYNIEIHAAKRRLGYGAATLLAAERLIAGEGAARLALHVFGFNQDAQRLYQRLGFEITGINMAKPIGR